MRQGVLPFQYQEEHRASGMTGLAGLPLYLELAHVAGSGRSIEQHVGVRAGGQGWTDAQVVLALVLLQLAGGEAVNDLRMLEADGGLGEVVASGDNGPVGRGGSGRGGHSAGAGRGSVRYLRPRRCFAIWGPSMTRSKSSRDRPIPPSFRLPAAGLPRARYET